MENVQIMVKSTKHFALHSPIHTDRGEAAVLSRNQALWPPAAHKGGWSVMAKDKTTETDRVGAWQGTPPVTSLYLLSHCLPIVKWKVKVSDISLGSQI